MPPLPPPHDVDAPAGDAPPAPPAPGQPAPHAAPHAATPTRPRRPRRVTPPDARRAWATGLAVVVALTAAFLAAQLVQGRRPFGPDGSAKDVRIALLHCVMAAFYPLALLHVRRRAAATLDALRALPAAGRPLPAAITPSRRVVAAAAAVSLVLAFLGPYLMEPEVGGPLFWWDPSRWEPETVWHRVLGPWAGVWSGLLGVTIVVVAWRSSRLAPAVDAADLTDQRRLAPYVQLALTNMLVAVGQFSLYAAFAVDFGVTAQVLLSAGVSVVIAAVALLLPLRGVRGRVVAVKRAELAWCDEELRRARAAVRAGADAVAPGRLADLAAYRNAVDGASDWGFDSPALRRVALYLLIPVGSWVASTLVQHALERYVLGG